MDLVGPLIPSLLVIGLVTPAVRFAGRLYARTTIRWDLWLKFAVIFILLCVLITPVAVFLRATGFWLGLSFILAAHAAVGGMYLAPRVIKQSGQSLGPVTGAAVGACAAVLGLAFSLPILFILGFRG